MASIVLFDHQKRKFVLGRRIGGGGEGEVFETHDNETVAKIYNATLSLQKINKLQAMSSTFDQELRAIAAWPERLLYDSGATVKGFLMPKVTDHLPIHELFNPSARKRSFPKADFAFLVQAARNLVAAFGAIHNHGCLIGDVNEGNFLVSQNAVVKLIDCDSFQIAYGNKVYPCEVGVPLYTAPELQGKGDFREKPRKQDHDLFGLGVMLFQLLFMGRHPYVGVYSGPEMTLEQAIACLHFSYGRTGLELGIKPPTGSLDYDSFFPASMRALFDNCFSKQGLLARPNASLWMRELLELKSHLKSCSRESNHKYHNSLVRCPYCKIEEEQGIYFFNISSVVDFGDTGPTVDQLWQQILSVQPPDSMELLNPTGISIQSNWLEVGKLLQILAIIQSGLAFIIPLALWINDSKSFFGWVLIGLLIYYLNPFRFAVQQKKNGLTKNLSMEESRWNELKKQWDTSASREVFFDARKQLEALKTEIENLGIRYKKERKELDSRAHELQLKKFLSNYFISHSSIKGIGDNRKYILRSFGIETASDVDKLKKRKIKGLGPHLVGQLRNWRDGLAKKFRFNPNLGIDPEEVRLLNRKFETMRANYIGSLTKGPGTLVQLKGRIVQARVLLRPRLEAAARSYATAYKAYKEFSI